MQIFTKNSGQWKAMPLTQEGIQRYKSAAAEGGISPVVAHAAYLINLCSARAVILKNSRHAFVDELRRCEALGIHALIFHPGSHQGRGEDEGITRIAESLNIAHEQTAHFHVLTTLEITAGQGTALGYRFEHLQRIIDLVEQKDRMAVCMDTCHLFAAGYDISTENGWEKTIRLFDDIVGLSRLVAIHVNDSKKDFNSRVDRHEHIGKGRIALTAFRMLMNDTRLAQVPKILETEKSEDMHEDVENLVVLRSLVSTAPQEGSAPGMER
jgi:deoxyribonuclease-4